jgi:MFS transporter, DHA1 family, inner membrane transport protein
MSVQPHSAAVPATTSPPRPGVSDRCVLAALCVAAFLAALNFYAPTPFYPQMARDLQTTIPLLGQVVTLMVLTSAGLGLLAGPLADRYGYRRPLLIGLLAIALNFLATAFAPAYPTLLGASILGAVGDALAFALPLAIAATFFAGEAQRRAIGWTLGALSSASVIGIPLLTTISGHTGWRMALAIAGGIAAGAAWFVAVALPPDYRRSPAPMRIHDLLEAYAPLLRHPPSVRLFCVAALRGSWWLGLVTYLGAFLGTAVGLDQLQVGMTYALTGAGYAISSVIAGRRLGRLSPRVLVATSSAAAGLLIGPMLILAQAWVSVPLLLGVGAASAVCGLGITALLANDSPAGADTTMVFNGSMLNLGTAGGAALGGLLIGLGGFSALGTGLPLCALAGACLAWWPGRREAGANPTRLLPIGRDAPA